MTRALLSGRFVLAKYRDHVLYHRSNPDDVMPHTRECIGWMVYECPEYIVIAWDRDSGPPRIRGGDPKASGMVLLRGDILELRRLE